MTTKLNRIYKAILDTANLAVTDDDCVSLKEYGDQGEVKLRPLTIAGQRLVLPTKQQLKNPNWDDRVCFHVFSENTARGESKVMERLRATLNARLNFVVPIIMMALLRVGASSSDHSKLNPEQAEFLSHVKNADDKTIDDFRKILDKMPVNTPTKQFINIYVRRSAKLEGKSFFRAGIVSFPFYADLLKGEAEIHGVKLRKKDTATLTVLLDYILPHQEETNYYSRGSNSTVAPTIDAVMQAMLAVTGPLNDVTSRFEGIISEEFLIPAEWAEAFENLNALIPDIRDVPMLAGNEGSIDDKSSTATQSTATPPGFYPPPATPPIHGQPLYPTSGAVLPPQDLARLDKVVQQQQHGQAKTMDMDSFLRGNPGLAAAVGYQTPGFHPGQPAVHPLHAGRATSSNPVAVQQQQWNNSGWAPAAPAQPQGQYWNGGGFTPSI